MWDAKTGEQKRELMLNVTRVFNRMKLIVWNPDGRRLAFVSGQAPMQVLDVETGMQMFTIEDKNYVMSIAWSPDGQCLAYATRDKMIHVLETELWEKLFEIPYKSTDNFVYSIKWSPDGRHLATVQSSFNGKTQVWDAKNGKHMYGLPDKSDNRIDSIAWSPDGRRLATTGISSNTEAKTEKGITRVWNAETGEHMFEIDHNYLVKLLWSPDGKRLATAGLDDPARVWNAETGDQILELNSWQVQKNNGFEGFTGIAWSPDGQRLATTSREDPFALMWNAKTGKQTCELWHGGNHEVTAVAWSPDGRRLTTASKNKTARVWDVHERGVREDEDCARYFN